MTRIRRQLTKVVKTRALHRAARKKVPYPVVALVGYTNAGKSTLFNRLTGAEVMAEDMLFATLDPTMRSVELPDGMEVILSDTVGFISDLPTQLVAAFRATLEEVLDADLILHIRDIAHPETEAQARDVAAILHDLGVGQETQMLEVWNKIDLLSPDRRSELETAAGRLDQVFSLSAVTGAGVNALLGAVADTLSPPRIREELALAFSEGRKRAWAYEQGIVENEVQDEDGYSLVLNWTARQKKTFKSI